MTLSIKKFESLIKESGLSDTKFAEKLGKNKNILYKYRNQKNYELNDLRTDFAIEISRVFKIDFYYFYDDSKPLSLNPAIDYPVVDSTQISELKRTINNLVEGMAKLTKKSEKSNRGYLEVIVDSASNAVSEFISATIKLNNIGKKYLNANADLAIIMRASSDALIAYAKRKSMDFTQKINTIDCSEAKDLEVALNDVYEFKKENAEYMLQVDNLINCLNKNEKLDYYSLCVEKLFNDPSGVYEKLDNISDDSFDLIFGKIDKRIYDFCDLIDISKALLIRDIIRIMDVPEVREALVPMVKQLFYVNGEFSLLSNPKTLEYLSNGFINMVNGDDYLKIAYDDVLEATKRNEELLLKYEKGELIC